MVINQKFVGDSSPSADRRVYELRFDKGAATGSLIREGTATDTEMYERPSEDALERFTTHQKELHTARLEFVEATQAVLGTVYHLAPPAFTKPWSHAAMSFIETLVDVADFYDCASVVKGHMGTYFQQDRMPVAVDCSVDPRGMLLFGIKVESDWVTMESCMWLLARPHPVWTEPCPGFSILAKIGVLGEKIHLLRHKFREAIMEVDLALFRMQPPPNLELHPERQWSCRVALNYFRSWLAVQPRGSAIELDYGKVYHQINEGNIAAHTSARDLGLLSDHDDRDVDGVRAALAAVFEQAKPIVAPLLTNVSAVASEHYERYDSDNKYMLRFMTISREELPWNGTK